MKVLPPGSGWAVVHWSVVGTLLSSCQPRLQLGQNTTGLPCANEPWKEPPHPCGCRASPGQQHLQVCPGRGCCPGAPGQAEFPVPAPRWSLLPCKHTAGRCSARTLLREPAQPKAALQEGARQGCSAGMLSASPGPWDTPSSELAGGGRDGANKVRQQDQGCYSVLLQLEGKIRQACLNTSLHRALSPGSFPSCYANLEQLVLLLVFWALCSLIHFKREGKGMAMNICFLLSA